MEELLEVLEQLYSNENDIYHEEGFIGFNESKLYDKAVGLCNEKLITNGGLCNWDNINFLRSHGYSVFAGEKDGFGWLTGCIRKYNDSRVIVYG